MVLERSYTHGIRRERIAADQGAKEGLRPTRRVSNNARRFLAVVATQVVLTDSRSLSRGRVSAVSSPSPPISVFHPRSGRSTLSSPRRRKDRQLRGG